MRSSTLAFLLGILACQMLNHLPDSRLALLIFPLLPAAVIYPRLRLIIFFIVGLLWTVWRANLILTPQLLPEIENQPVQVIGTIVEIPLTTNYGWSFYFIPSQLTFQGLNKSLPGKLQLSWFGIPPQPLSPGQEWQLQVRLKKVHPMLNPGVFDYSSISFPRGIRATGSVQSNSKEWRLLNNNPSSFQNIIDHWRYQLIKRIKDWLGDNPNTAIIIALAVGHQADIKPQQWEMMKRTGIVHLISVSGLHISLVAMLIFGIARRFWNYLGQAALWLPADYFAILLSVFAATSYALLAGFSVPTQRSLVMIIVIMIGIFLARTLTGSRILAMALLAVLIYEPLAVMSIGFWLSFGALATMRYALNGRRPLRESSWLIRWGINTATTQWAVTLGLFPPLLAWSGNGFLLITSLLANTVAIPWFSLLTVLVLIGTSLIFVLPELSHFLLQISVYLLDAIWVFPT